MSDLEKVKSFFANDEYATKTTGIEILEADRGFSKVQLKIENRHRNAIGMVMGAVYFTLADFAFAVATNSNPESDVSTVTLSSQINFLSPSKGDLLFAEAREKKEGHSAVFYDVDVYEISDGTKKISATCSITGFKLHKK